MRITLWTLAISLLIAGTAQAEDINGKWKASQVLENGELIPGGGGGLIYVFNNGQFTTSIASSARGKGTYTIDNGQLVLNFTEPRKYTLNCSYTLEGKRLTYMFKSGSTVTVTLYLE